MVTPLHPGDKDWVHGDYRGTLTEAMVALNDGVWISAYGFGKPNTWATVYPVFRNDGLYRVHLHANRQRDEQTTYTRDPAKELPQILRDFGHRTGNARWFWGNAGEVTK